eukprot:656052-Pleurochrysis_carterae.AAC.2
MLTGRGRPHAASAHIARGVSRLVVRRDQVLLAARALQPPHAPRALVERQLARIEKARSASRAVFSRPFCGRILGGLDLLLRRVQAAYAAQVRVLRKVGHCLLQQAGKLSQSSLSTCASAFSVHLRLSFLCSPEAQLSMQFEP